MKRGGDGRTVRRIVALFGAALVLVGCGEGGAEEPSASKPPSATTTRLCDGVKAAAVTLTTSSGTELEAALLGDGQTGVVLGHQLRQDYCSWLPFAVQLAERGMKVLAINFASLSPDDDMLAAAEELRRRGASRIVLVGASMGGTAALVAGAQTGVAAIATLSAPRRFGDLDALPSVQQLDVPALFLVGGQDIEFARDARELFDAMKSAQKTLVVTEGSEHGTDLLEDPKAQRALLDFLADHAMSDGYWPSASSAKVSVSSRPGTPSTAPTAVVASAPTAFANRAERSSGQPAREPWRSPATNASPAPVPSTTATGNPSIAPSKPSPDT
jgi:pimeloyl-ACP methyl ester carboxylesterase